MTASKQSTIAIKVPPMPEPERLDRFLAGCAELGFSRNKIQWLIKSGAVTVGGETPAASLLVAGGETIEILLPEPTPTEVRPEKITLDILFEDDCLAVVNKPAGMVTHPAAGVHEGTLANALVYHFAQLRAIKGHNRPGIVHRLDKNTSGLLLVAKDESTLATLQNLMQERAIHREYIALICGHMPEPNGTIDLPIGRSRSERTKMAVSGIGERESITHYVVTDSFRSYDLLNVRLETGRTHQIRVHLAHLNHPVFGDPEYGGREQWHRGLFAPERPLAKRLLAALPRQALHAHRLSFVHPISGQSLSFDRPVPSDFQRVLDLLDSEGR